MDSVVLCTIHDWAVWWHGAQSARDNHLLACIFAKYSPILFSFTGTLSYYSFLIWLLTTPPHLNASLIACFLRLMFHKVVLQHTQGLVGFLIIISLQIYQRMSQWKNFENRIRFNRYIAMSMVSPFLRNTVYMFNVLQTTETQHVALSSSSSPLLASCTADAPPVRER